MSDSKARIRILHLEDNPRDGELVEDLLESAGLDADIVRARGREDFEADLARGSFA
jgi:hypothetical protein